MSSFRDSELDHLLRSCLKGAVAGRQPSAAVWSGIEQQVLAAHDGPARHEPVRGLVHAVRRQLLQIERYLFFVPVQYQRLSDSRMAVSVLAMAYPSAGCVPLAFV
jgi:hypothetical protein